MYSSSDGIISLISVFQMGGTLCTKSVTPSRIQENFNVWDFKWVQEYQATLQAILYPKNFLYLFHRLTDEDMAVMDSLVRKIWRRAKDIGIIIVFNFLRTWVGFTRRNTEIVFEN